MFKNISISKRLTGSFGLLIALLLLASITGLTHMAGIMESLEQTSEGDLPKMLLAKDLSYNFMDSNQSMYELQVVKTPAERERVKGDIERIRKNASGNIEKLQKIIFREDVKASLIRLSLAAKRCNLCINACLILSKKTLKKPLESCTVNLILLSLIWLNPFVK